MKRILVDTSLLSNRNSRMCYHFFIYPQSVDTAQRPLTMTTQTSQSNVVLQSNTGEQKNEQKKYQLKINRNLCKRKRRSDNMAVRLVESCVELVNLYRFSFPCTEHLTFSILYKWTWMEVPCWFPSDLNII